MRQGRGLDSDRFGHGDQVGLMRLEKADNGGEQ
jgi:hypothetical protein